MGGKIPPLWQGGLIFLVVYLAYLPALNGSFVWDDDSWTTNILRLLRDSSGLGSIWFLPTAMQQYYPLTGTTFWLDYHLWQFWTTPYHLENILLHALGSVLFWRLLVQLRVPGAWLAGAIFALHPVMVESVAWITERKNVLSLVFFLGALLAYGRFARWAERLDENAPAPDALPGRGRPAFYYGLAFILFLGALLAKTTTFSLPAVILLIGWWRRGQIRWRTDVLPTLPFFALSMVFCAVTGWLEKNHVGAAGADFALTFPQRCLVAGHAFWFYLGNIMWPSSLCFVYPRWQPDAAVWWQWLYPVTAAGALFTLWLFRGRIGRGPVTAMFFFVGTLFPVLGFMNAYGMRYSFVWDHWVYLSSLGIIALVAALVVWAASVWRQPAAGLGFAVIVLPVLALLTWQQAGMFTDMETLWRTTLARNPASWLANNNLGLWLSNQNRNDEAIEFFHQAIASQPTYCETPNNLGLVLAAEGRVDEAMACYRQTLRIDPSQFGALNNLGNALFARGRYDEAINNYFRALQLNPEYYVALNNLGVALSARGRPDAAIRYFRKALELKPDYFDALKNLATSLAARRQFEEAVGYYRRAIQVNPERPDIFLGLGHALGQTGHDLEARDAYQEAMILAPDLAVALNNQAWALATNPNPDTRSGVEAVRLAEQACEVTQFNRPLFLGTLAAAYAEAGRFSDAVATAEKAERLATQAGLPEVAARNRQLLELYHAGKAYHAPVQQ